LLGLSLIEFFAGDFSEKLLAHMSWIEHSRWEAVPGFPLQVFLFLASVRFTILEVTVK
jgi:hypothetical protein